ncbi:MAG: acylphosphatase [Candidatus Omnitrophota bacterium]
MKKQLHLIYSGRVQGIGFRYTVLDIARQQKVGGWVKNLDDGKVEIIAEADEDLLKIFLLSINQHFSNYVNDLEIRWLPASGELNVFEIKF